MRACLPCVAPPIDDDHDEAQQQSLYVRDELQGLLFDSDHEVSTPDAETMSLRSDIGGRRRRRRKRRPAGPTVRIFGFDLFGRPRAASPSPPPSDDEAPRSLRTSYSTLTLDSDATPLPDAMIANLSVDPTLWEPRQTEEELAREEEEQRLKEERRAARRSARKARKMAQAEAEGRANLAAGFTSLDGDDFEGFQGSGSGTGTPHTTLLSPAMHMSMNSSSSADAEGEDEFGPYIDVEGGGPEENADVPDFGGEYYGREKNASSRIGFGEGSSTSRTRSSNSEGNGRSKRLTNANLAVQNAHLVPLPPSSAGSITSFQPQAHSQPTTKPRKSKKSKPQSISLQSGTSQSASLASPPAQSPSNFPSPLIVSHEARSALQSSDYSVNESQSSDFPSTGFNAPGRKRNNLQAGLGVALANRG